MLLRQGKGAAQVRGCQMVLHPPLRQASFLWASLPAEVPRRRLWFLQTHRSAQLHNLLISNHA